LGRASQLRSARLFKIRRRPCKLGLATLGHTTDLCEQLDLHRRIRACMRCAFPESNHGRTPETCRRLDAPGLGISEGFQRGPRSTSERARKVRGRTSPFLVSLFIAQLAAPTPSEQLIPAKMILIISACEVGSCDPGCTGAGGRGSRAHIVGCWHAPQATAPEVTSRASCGVKASGVPDSVLVAMVRAS